MDKIYIIFRAFYSSIACIFSGGMMGMQGPGMYNMPFQGNGFPRPMGARY